MRKLLASIDVRDVIAGVGLSLIGIGLSFVSIAAALAVPGLLLFACAVVPAILTRGDR